jgi:hypothetical protein
MRILVVNIDSVIPNLALAKIVKFHQDKGDEVRQIKDKTISAGLPYPLLIDTYDKIYVSCVFSWNKNRCMKWESIADIGGSGYSLEKTLPPEIDAIKPRMNMGFITRGCTRNCPWCIVPKKEGKVHQVGDIYDLWDGKSNLITIMDNNILALPKVFFETSKQLKKEKLMVDFNQGLDHRLLTDEICQELFSLKYPGSTGSKIRFAFDHISYKKSVLKALKMLKRNGLKDWRTRWYVYVGVEDTVETVVERINILRDEKQAVFLMRDRDKRVMQNKEFANMYIWTNHIELYAHIPYEKFDVSMMGNLMRRPDNLLRDM